MYIYMYIRIYLKTNDICDWILANMHSLRIQFCTFKGSLNVIGKTK